MGSTDVDIEKHASTPPSPSTDTSSTPTSRSNTPPPDEKADITAVAAPPANTSEVLDIVHSPSHSRSPSTKRPAPSISSSVHRDPVKIPRSKRRGLLARVAVLAEVEEPKDYTRRTKWIITFIIAIAGAAAPMGSGIILPALTDIDKAFDTSPTITNLSVAMFMLSMSIFPLWWSSFSETLGRRTIYLISFLLFLVFNILSAVSTGIAMFIVMRILSGGAAASVQAVGAGTIADIWEVRERGRAMGIFYLGPLCGPLISPIVGGALADGLGWRSDMWFLVVYGVVLWLAILFFLPETLKARKSVAAEAEAEVVTQIAGDGKAAERPGLTRMMTRQSVHAKTKKYATVLRRWFLDPLAIVLHLRNPAVAITVYYASITFGSLYVLNISVQQTFSAQPYHFSTIIVGLLYIPNSLGYIIASIFGGRWVDAIMHREARKAGRYDDHGKLVFRPEDRMKENAYAGAILYPAGLLWYGWTAGNGVMWVAPMFANFFFGLGSMLIFAMATTMLTEFMPKKASHGIALNNFVRNIFSCVGGVVASPLIDAIGDGWLFTILSIWCFLSGVIVVWAMKRFGPHWREAMDKRLNEEN
ncbi:hypothetical protein M8818_004252 [Zalaria obscura]|uniref:Uncharacterized protein n=1 Tax=Zalaria obscura TaxID=2024903 RepID=A0ACC3SC52_9PEZI